MLRFQDLIHALNTVITSYQALNKTNTTRTTLLDYLNFGIQRLEEAQTIDYEQDTKALQNLQNTLTLMLQHMTQLFDKHVLMDSLEITYADTTVLCPGLKTTKTSDAAELIKTHLLTPLDLTETSTPEVIASRISAMFQYEHLQRLRLQQQMLEEAIDAKAVRNPPPFPHIPHRPFKNFIERLVIFIIRQVEAPSDHDIENTQQSLSAWVLIEDSPTIDTLLQTPISTLHTALLEKITDSTPNAVILRELCSGIPYLLEPEPCHEDNVQALILWLNTLITQTNASPLKKLINRDLLMHAGLSFDSHATLTISIQRLVLREHISRLTLHDKNLTSQQEKENRKDREDTAKLERTKHLTHYLERDVITQQPTSAHNVTQPNILQQHLHPLARPAAGSLVSMSLWNAGKRLLHAVTGKSDPHFSDDEPDNESDNESNTSEHSTSAQTGYTSS
jgi:hypothetical protein